MNFQNKLKATNFDFFDKPSSNFPPSDYRSRHFKGKWVRHYVNNLIELQLSKGFTSSQEDLFGHNQEHLPKHLYKFFKINDRNINSILSGNIKLSQTNKFNDPFDCHLLVEQETYLKDYLLKELKNSNNVTKEGGKDKLSEQEYWKICYSQTTEAKSRNIFSPGMASFQTILFEIQQQKSDEFWLTINRIQVKGSQECSKKTNQLRKNQLLISCFSKFLEEEEMLINNPMWAHYTDNHKGICIRYKIDSKRQEKSIVLNNLFPVHYTSVAPKISSKELLKEKDILNLKNPKILKAAYKTFLTKSMFWNYEKEWRLVLDAKLLENRISDPIEFLEIDKIYLGLNINQILKDKILKYCDENGIEVLKTKMRNEKFQLDTFPVNGSNYKSNK